MQLFTLRIRTHSSMITIRAFDCNTPSYDTHNRIDVEVIQGGSVIFPKGALYCGLPNYKSIDSSEAKELVLDLVSMRKGDTDEDYFSSYTPKQLAWADKYGEILSAEKFRFGNSI